MAPLFCTPERMSASAVPCLYLSDSIGAVRPMRGSRGALLPLRSHPCAAIRGARDAARPRPGEQGVSGCQCHRGESRFWGRLCPFHAGFARFARATGGFPRLGNLRWRSDAPGGATGSPRQPERQPGQQREPDKQGVALAKAFRRMRPTMAAGGYGRKGGPGRRGQGAFRVL
jgi:hypothetical protein